MKTSGPFAAFSVCHFVGSLLFWPLGARARSVGRREQVSGDDTVARSMSIYSSIGLDRCTLRSALTLPRSRRDTETNTRVNREPRALA